MSDATLRIVGAQGSPYSRKLRAVLRYRRIAHAWVNQGSPESRGLPRPRVELLPQLIVTGADGALEAKTDSTPLIRELEATHAGRSVIPSDPVVSFLDALIEDYADEWLTKAMFHYRWAFAPDVAQAQAILPRWFRPDGGEQELLEAGRAFGARQVARLAVVGSNPTTAPVIEDSYRRLLRLLDARLTGSRFVLGRRPGTADFGLYGQLTQLAGFDPTSRAIALETAPRIVAWTDLVDDLSGVEVADADWLDRASAGPALRPLLEEIGRTYAPFLVANADALERSAETVECAIDGRRWTQKPFPYQRKCLQALRAARATLPDADRAALDAILAGTGCEVLWDRRS